MRDYADIFKAQEIFQVHKVVLPYIIRLDGWCFKTFTKEMKYEKPYDKSLTHDMVLASSQFAWKFQPTLGFYFSDEVSFLFTKPTIFDRVEKLDSLFASYFTSEFVQYVEENVAFDCRVVPMKDLYEIKNYFVWRQDECLRNHNNGWAEWVMTHQEGLSPMVAAKKLKGLKSNELHKICLENGLDLNKTPQWQRNGIVLYQHFYKKEGFNPITKEKVMVDRREVNIDWETPSFYKSQYIEGKINEI